MSRGHLALCAIYTLTSLWLAWLTITAWSHVALWVSLLNVAASVVLCMAVADTSANADEVRDLRVQLERALRPDVAPPTAPQPVADPPVLSATEQAAFDEIAANYRKDEAA